jgi:hypothetical protein
MSEGKSRLCSFGLGEGLGHAAVLRMLAGRFCSVARLLGRLAPEYKGVVIACFKNKSILGRVVDVYTVVDAF